MSRLWRRLLELWRARSSRERGLVALGAIVAFVLVVQVGIVQPLREQLRVESERASRLEFEVRKAERLAAEALQLRGDLSRVEAEVARADKTNLFTLLESLAASAGVKDQLESIKPKQPSGNPAYPETRVEVSLRGATLQQVIQLLHQIERAPTHLIVRSLRLKAQGGKESRLLDARFSVSSFERA
jgi:hypothetical protein